MENTIGHYIKNIRANLHLTQAQLAKLIGTKRVNIAKYETGSTMPPGNVLLKIQQIEKEH